MSSIQNQHSAMSSIQNQHSAMSSIQNHIHQNLNWLLVVLNWLLGVLNWPLNHIKAFIHQNLNWLPGVLNWLLGEPESQQNYPESPPVIQQLVKIEHWANVIVSLCFASAIQIALVSVQLHSHLLPIFHSLSLCILFGFASLFISIVINTKLPNTARLFGAASVFFVFTAFFIAISILFPLYLKLTVLVVYAVCLIIVILTLYSSYRS